MKIFTTLSLIVAAFSLSVILLQAPASVFAQDNSLFKESKQQACRGAQLDNSATTSNCTKPAQRSFNKLLSTIINIFSVVVGIVAVIMIIISGLRYITSGGDSNSISAAKNTLLYAVVGLIIVAFAQFIVKFVISKATA